MWPVHSTVKGIDGASKNHVDGNLKGCMVVLLHKPILVLVTPKRFKEEACILTKPKLSPLALGTLAPVAL